MRQNGKNHTREQIYAARKKELAKKHKALILFAEEREWAERNLTAGFAVSGKEEQHLVRKSKRSTPYNYAEKRARIACRAQNKRVRKSRELTSGCFYKLIGNGNRAGRYQPDWDPEWEEERELEEMYY